MRPMQAIFDIMQQHSSTWSEAAWQVLLTRVLISMFHMPQATQVRGRDSNLPIKSMEEELNGSKGGRGCRSQMPSMPRL